MTSEIYLTPTGHAKDCDWHVDQYPWECTCGFIPRKKRFRLGDRVTKIKGSSWTGRVVGFYSTSLTPEGYAVESENEPGSVQIYPVGALEMVEQKSA